MDEDLSELTDSSDEDSTGFSSSFDEDSAELSISSNTDSDEVNGCSISQRHSIPDNAVFTVSCVGS